MAVKKVTTKPGGPHYPKRPAQPSRKMSTSRKAPASGNMRGGNAPNPRPN